MGREWTAGPTFEAQYHGICPRCAEKIEPGDLVRYVNDELVHRRHSKPTEEKPTEVCGSCWLVKPCECE